MEHLQRRLLPSTTALAAFDAVARLGSFSAAAAALDLTPGAVSRHISLLEGRLGVSLVLRTNRGVSLTDRGRRYAEGVGKVIRSICLLAQEAKTQSSSGALNLAILPTFGTRWLLPRLPDFVARNPDIAVNFANRLEKFDIEADGLDGAFHFGEPDWQECHCHFLMRETVAPVCSPAFLAKNPIPSPEALLSSPLLEVTSRPHAWRRWFASVGIDKPYRKGMHFEQFTNVIQASSAGLGIALLPLFLIHTEFASSQLVNVLDSRALESQAAYYFVVPVCKLEHDPVVRFSEWLAGQVEPSCARREFSQSSSVFEPQRLAAG